VENLPAHGEAVAVRLAAPALEAAR
jgi:hypothetical protein